MAVVMNALADFPEGLVSPRAAAELLGLPAQRLRSIAQSGALPCCRPGRHRRYCARAVRELAEGGKLLDVRAAARRLGVSARTLTRLVGAGKIAPALVLERRGSAPGAYKFFSTREVERFLQASSSAGRGGERSTREG